MVMADIVRLTGFLAALQKEFPSFGFELQRTWNGAAIAAVRERGSGSPHTLVTNDPDELRAALVTAATSEPAARELTARTGGGDTTMAWAHATHNLKHASTDTLMRLREAAAVLIEHDQQISPRVMTDLLLIREETTAALQETGQTAEPADRAVR